LITKRTARKIVYRALASWLEKAADEGWPFYDTHETGLVDSLHNLTRDGEKIKAAIEEVVREFTIRGAE
jgi:hypothetical protein